MALSLDDEDLQRHLEPLHHWDSNRRAWIAARPRRPPPNGKPWRLGARALRDAREREKTASYELPGGAGEVVGQRARLADEVRRALVVPLVEGGAGLIQEFLGGPQ